MSNKNREIAQGKIKDGWIHFDRYFKGALEEFCRTHEGMKIWIEIQAGNIRSIAQNNFFHGPLMDGFVRATGDTDREWWKWHLKDKFLRVYRADGKYRVKGTSELTKTEKMEFLDKCIGYLQDQFHGYLTEYEHKEYLGTLGQKDRDFYSDNRDQTKMPWHQPGTVK